MRSEGEIKQALGAILAEPKPQSKQRLTALLWVLSSRADWDRAEQDAAALLKEARQPGGLAERAKAERAKAEMVAQLPEVQPGEQTVAALMQAGGKERIVKGRRYIHFDHVAEALGIAGGSIHFDIDADMWHWGRMSASQADRVISTVLAKVNAKRLAGAGQGQPGGQP